MKKHMVSLHARKKHVISIYVDDPEQFHVDLKGDVSTKHVVTDEEVQKLTSLLDAQTELQRMLGEISKRKARRVV